MATTLGEVFKSTADAIRSKTGKTDKIKPIDFAKEIEGISVGSGVSGSMVIDYSYRDYEIPDWGFEYLPIIEMVIPDDVIVIGTMAFSECDVLSKIKLPTNLREIREGAFRYCCSLTEIEIPDEVTSIGDYAFWYCTSLRKAKLPDVLKELPYGLFDSCYDLVEINIPSNCEVIGGYAFSNCHNLKEVILPDSVKQLHYGAFAYCWGIATLVVPADVESNAAFIACSPQYMTIPTNVIGNFDHDMLQISLKELTVRGGGEVLGLPGDETNYARTFQVMTCLEKLTMGDNITKVPSTQFYQCTSLKEVVFGENVTWMGEATFACCPILRRVDCSKCKQIPEQHFCPFDNTFLNEDIQIKVPAGKLNEWQNTDEISNIRGWSYYKDRMVEEFTNTPELELESYDLRQFDWSFTDMCMYVDVPYGTAPGEFKAFDFDVEFIQSYDYIEYNKIKFDGTTLYYCNEDGDMAVYNVMEGWYNSGYKRLIFNKPVSKEFFEWFIKRVYVNYWR